MTYTKAQLEEILRVHLAWIRGKTAGVRANLSGAKNLSPLQLAQMRITPESGAFIGWKKCRNGIIVKLQIPAEAQRSNAPGGRKCRAEFVDVLEIIGGTEAFSMHNREFGYVVGIRATPDAWCDDAMQECAGGIHFSLSRVEAENYE